MYAVIFTATGGKYCITVEAIHEQQAIRRGIQWATDNDRIYYAIEAHYIFKELKNEQL